MSQAAFEPQYTAQELAALWKLSPDSIRRLFQDEPGVFRLGAAMRRGKRGYQTLRIPASVAARVYALKCRAA